MNTIYEAYFLFYGFQIVLFTYLPTLFGVWIIVLVFEFFLVAFTKLFKATISLAMSVRLSVSPSAWNNSAPTGRILVTFCTRDFY